jgi:protein tyrosine/serine phosphatase
VTPANLNNVHFEANILKKHVLNTCVTKKYNEVRSKTISTFVDIDSRLQGAFTNLV